MQGKENKMFGLREKCKERKTKRKGREKELFVWLEINGGKERKMEGMNFNGTIIFFFFQIGEN